MPGKIVMNLAMSLDGYIADQDGGFAWIQGQGDQKLDTAVQYDHAKFLADIDIVVMGKTCYDQGFAADYASKKVYVATHNPEHDRDNLRFISGDIVSPLLREKAQGRKIYLFGGGIMLDDFLKMDVIDEYIVGMIPVILGQGRRLFMPDNPQIALHLKHYLVNDGIVILHYLRR